MNKNYTKHVRELMRKIDEHFRNEAKIIIDLLKSELTKEELKDLIEYMQNHPFSKISEFIQEIHQGSVDT